MVQISKLTKNEINQTGFKNRSIGSPMQNAWVTSWTGFTDHERHRGNSGWESTSIPLQWVDPLPLPTVSGTPQVGKNYLLDEKCPVQGFVSVAPTSLSWKDKVGNYEVKLTQGLAVSLYA
jgi:hypothetical protein